MRRGTAMKRLHATFSGTVQGVGFRYTAIRIAARARVTGWVKNLADGRVEIVAEGAEEALEQVVRELRDYFHTYVRDVHVEWEEPTGEFSKFGVQF
jgi:acylphosphatase